MLKKRFSSLLSALAGLSMAVGLMLAGGAVHTASATVILEGSDAIGYHSGSNAFAAAYRDQVWTALGGSSPLPIAVIGRDPVTAGTIISTTHPISRFQTLADAQAVSADLSGFIALYYLSPTGCCSEYTPTAAEQTAMGAYLTAGGTLMIEDYEGGAAWDFAVGTSGGADPGTAIDIGCNDGETVTADGLTNGFTQPGPMGCWTHQAYDEAFFAPLGFTLSFFDSPPAYPGFSSLLSNGLTRTGEEAGIPEPTTLAILGLGLAGLGFARRRKAA